MKTLYQLPFTDLSMKFFDKETKTIYKVPMGSVFATDDNSRKEHIANYTERLTKLVGEFEVKLMYEPTGKPLEAVSALAEMPKPIQRLFKKQPQYKSVIVQYAQLVYSNGWRGTARGLIEKFVGRSKDPMRNLSRRNKPFYRWLDRQFVNDRDYIRQVSTCTFLSVVVNKDDTETAIAHMETALYALVEDMRGYLFAPSWVEALDHNGVDKNMVLTCGIFLNSNASKYMQTIAAITPEQRAGTHLDCSLVSAEGRIGLNLTENPTYPEVTIGYNGVITQAQANAQLAADRADLEAKVEKLIEAAGGIENALTYINQQTKKEEDLPGWTDGAYPR